MSSIGLAMLGFLVWGHHLFVAGMSEFATMIFSALTFLVAIPSGVKVFNWTATMYKGSIVWASPMLYAMAFIFLFTIGGLTGLFLGTLSVDVHLTDTYFVVAHFHYVMMGGTVIAFLGGLLYWWPKMTGKMHDETKAKIGFWLVFIGFNTVFIPQFIMGSRGMPRRYYDYLPQFEPFHKASTIGSWILATGLFLTAYTLLEALWKGRKAPRNPWGSAGYEWMTDTPPCLANFHPTPIDDARSVRLPPGHAGGARNRLGRGRRRPCEREEEGLKWRTSANRREARSTVTTTTRIRPSCNITSTRRRSSSTRRSWGCGSSSRPRSSCSGASSARTPSGAASSRRSSTRRTTS